MLLVRVVVVELRPGASMAGARLFNTARRGRLSDEMHGYSPPNPTAPARRWGKQDDPPLSTLANARTAGRVYATALCPACFSARLATGPSEVRLPAYD